MRALRVGLCGFLAGMLLLAGSVQAGTGGESCHRINAKGVGQDLGGGHTTARIIGGGLLHGTTAGAFTIGGAPPVFAIQGSVVFTTSQATLAVGVSGTFDVSTGAFSASGPVTAATGKLEGS